MARTGSPRHLDSKPYLLAKAAGARLLAGNGLGRHSLDFHVYLTYVQNYGKKSNDRSYFSTDNLTPQLLAQSK